VKKTNSIIIVLLCVTITLQGYRLYRDYNPPSRPATVRDAPVNAILETRDLPAEGEQQAKVALVQFSDYECPFCARHAAGVAAEIKNRFISTGLVRHVFVNLPIQSHASATLLAKAAICAGSQNHYWEMHNRLFVDNPRTRPEIVYLAEKLSLSVENFEACLDSPAASSRVESDTAVAKELQIRSTPSFAVGHLNQNGQVTVQKIISGAQPFSVFEETLRTALNAN
jgi:protein-disulfide isomerase